MWIINVCVFDIPCFSHCIFDLEGLQHKSQKSCSRCNKNTWHIESSYILQPPKILLLFVNRFRYINNNVTKDRCPIPMDTTVRLGPLKFSLRATIDHHGPSIHSGHYTASINCCKNILLQRSHNLGVWNYSLKSSTAYVILSRVTLYTAGHLHAVVPHCLHSRAPIVHTAVPRENNEHGCVYLRCRAVCKLPGCVEGHPWLYELIDPWFLDSNRRVGVWSLPWRWHILSVPLTTGRGTSAETCGLDDVFSPDDLGFRPEALCQYIYIYAFLTWVLL